MIDLAKFQRSGIIDTGVDWLTVTQVTGLGTSEMLDAVRKYIADEYPKDALPKKWAAMGYIGQNYGELKFGRRKQDESILILSGSQAERWSLKFNTPHDRVKRCDIQVTVALPENDPDLAHKLYRDLTSGPKSDKMVGKYKYVSSATGDTLYAGSRKSSVYMRLYDKAKDYNGADRGGVWRYEVEYKGALAKSVTKALNESEARYRDIATLVWGVFSKRGIDPAFEASNRIIAMEAGMRVTTVDSKLAWLERCVAPVVTQLVALGYEKEVLQSMKLRGIVKG